MAHHHHHHHAEADPPVDDIPSPPVVPTPPASETPPVETPPVETTPNQPVGSTFSDLGTTFNDATRSLVGGLWQNVVEEGGQGTGTVARYTNVLTMVQNGLLAQV